jgi:DNA polymerase III delta prime subunit
MDVLEFDAASNTQVDKIREIIIDNVKYAPAHGKFKMYIVDEVHMLSASSFNALLKTLEEPPEHVKFVFATTDPQKVPTTIISRCQRFDLKRIPAALISAHLLMIAGKERSRSRPRRRRPSRAGRGRNARRGVDARSARGLLRQHHHRGGRAQRVRLHRAADRDDALRSSARRRCARRARSVHAQAEGGKDLMRLLADLIAHLRNLLVAKADPAGLTDELTEEQVAALIAQAERVAMDRLLDLIEQFAAAEGRMKWAPNKKMHLEVAVIRAIQTLNQATLTEVLDTLTALRGGHAATRQARTEANSRAEADRRESRGTFTGARPFRPRNSIDNRSGEPLATAIRTIRDERHPLRLWASSGTLLSLDGGTAVLGFQSDQSLAAGHCEEPANRQYLEDLLSRPRETTAQTALRIARATRCSRHSTGANSGAEAEPVRDPMEDFKNDPLIRRALELFKAEIQPT